MSQQGGVGLAKAAGVGVLLLVGAEILRSVVQAIQEARDDGFQRGRMLGQAEGYIRHGAEINDANARRIADLERSVSLLHKPEPRQLPAGLDLFDTTHNRNGHET